MNAINNTQNSIELDDLLVKAKSGDIDAKEQVYSRFMPMVHRVANSFYLLGGDNEDLLQEGMIGLFKAIDDYDFDKSNFFAFAQMCVRRKILTAINATQRSKNLAILNASNIDDQVMLSDNKADPLEIVVGKDLLEELRDFIDKNLTDTEQETLRYFTKGYSYTEIATLTNKPYKAIDTALQRARKKLSQFKEQ